MTSPSSFNVSGLLGGAAGSIDTTALVTQLVQAAALPQTQLKNQLSLQQSLESAYTQLSSKLTAMQTAAQALTDPTAWGATTATSSSSGVAATSSTSALTGTTTFDVLALASAQVSTVAANASGVVASNPANGITITTADGVAHQLTLASGSAADVAAAVNTANIGVRAAVVNTDTGTVLQLTSAATGAAHSFTTAGFDTAAQNVVTAQDAKIGVGNVAAGGYTVSSATNTFTNVIPGVTFSVSAIASGVSITVASDEKSMSGKASALVDAINTAAGEMTSATGQGAILQGAGEVQSVLQSVMFAVSKGTASGGSLKTYGIDMDKTGKVSFDATAFAAAYAADPAGTKSAISGFAGTLDGAAATAIDPTNGTFTQATQASKSAEDRLNKQIAGWTTRLADTQQRLQAKYTAMETALAKLQSQSNYLTSMFKSMTSSSSSSSSN